MPGTNLCGVESLYFIGRIGAKSKISSRDIFIRKEIVEFSQIFNNQALIEKSIKESEAELQYGRAAQGFRQGNMKEAVEALPPPYLNGMNWIIRWYNGCFV